MTPAQERALLKRVRLGIGKDLGKATEQLKRLIRKGMAPRDAVDKVFGKFARDYGRLYQNSMAEATGNKAVIPRVNLSQRLYQQSMQVAAGVDKIVTAHRAGYQDARKLARKLYDGYDPNRTEVIKFNRNNKVLPKYMREAVLSAGDTREVRKAFAKLQTRKLTSPALNAAYSGVLKALDKLEDGFGEELLQRKLEVAFYEKARFLANRVAQTELHRSYAMNEALNLREDDDVQFVQLRRSGSSQTACICDHITTVDNWGMGGGVYPKNKAPVPPFHPFCRCVLSPRLDLTGKKQKKEKQDDTFAEFNRKKDPLYRVQTIDQIQSN